MVPKTESELRINILQARLCEKAIDGALFVYPIDVYYFTGVRQNAVLWVPAEGVPVIFVKKSLTRAVEESVLEDVRPYPSSQEFAAFFDKGIVRIGLTFDVLPMLQYQYYSKLLTGKEFIDLSDINRRIRSVKSPWEIEQMRESGRMLCEAFKEVPSFLNRGMRERDLAAELEYRLRTTWSAGNLRMRAFNQEITGLAVAGANAAAPGCFDGPVTGRGLSNASPYGPSDSVIPENAPVLLDYPGVFNGYIVDMTRIFAFGNLDQDMKTAFNLALEIQEWLVENIKPGTICEDLFAGAMGMAEKAGLQENFMGYPGEQARFVGHGVGLELDELPVLAQKFKTPLEAGQTIAIEPKFVFPGRGVVGIENTVAVTVAGGEKLTDLSDQIVYL
jgi:Xaa-Pro aminopeptidase